MYVHHSRTALKLVAVLVLCLPSFALATDAMDPGVRTQASVTGAPIGGLTPGQAAAFQTGSDDFSQTQPLNTGLGPRFNLDSCGGCHAQPALGGTSPAANPQVAVGTAFGARNTIPFFVTPSGPVREARFKYHADGTRDGGVHDLFVISGRNDGTADASRCAITQDNFVAAAKASNLVFRIPTPLFGAGLIEAIDDATIVTNQESNATTKAALGIHGRPHRVQIMGTTNNNGNDGTIARFGWKAQNKSLLLFSGEAYNVEMGISNELFPTERDETLACQFYTTPNDTTHEDGTDFGSVTSDIEHFVFFMRLLAPPPRSPDTPGGAPSIARGQAIFGITGCADCHTPALMTGNATITALANQPVPLFSDLLLHHMGPGLADDIVQGQAGPDEFRTAPLWGLGQRIFFLHDGRTSDLLAAVEAHHSAASSVFPASEANRVIERFNDLSDGQKQDVLNFLRSL
ncbi:MAG TPA: di-heme oxidoredictase family protein [Myxococcota bacterium]|nr:di-heme oxidoredictase family protein [Myxococcota bacterium]